MCSFVKYRRASRRASPKEIYLQWLAAIDIHNEHKYSFWDSAIIATAIEGGAGEGVRQSIGGLLVSQTGQG